jgi:hypothetical protein
LVICAFVAHQYLVVGQFGKYFGVGFDITGEN